jgi:hypothetical protein
LIKISKTKEINGIIVKYYKAKAKILFVTDFPFESIVSDNSAIIQSLYPRFYKIITELLINKKSLILKASKSKTICKICKINHQHEFILFLIFSVVITMVLNNILKK